MFLGTVNSSLEPIVPLLILDAGNHWITLDAMVDTGYEGLLTLPLSTIQRLGLPTAGIRATSLADGSVASVPLYAATIDWDGQNITLLVLGMGDIPLIGMQKLDGFQLRIDVKPGGAVTIEPLP